MERCDEKGEKPATIRHYAVTRCVVKREETPACRMKESMAHFSRFALAFVAFTSRPLFSGP